LLDVENEWMIYLQNALSELGKNFVLPPVVCLTAGNDSAALYAGFLRSFKVFRLDTPAMSHLCDSDSKFKPNIFLSVLTVFLHNFSLQSPDTAIQ